MSVYHKIKRTVSSDGEILKDETSTHYMPFVYGRGYNFKFSSAKLKNYLDIPIPKTFTASENGRIHWLAEKIHVGSNLLKKWEGKTMVPMTRDDIREVVGLCRSKFSPFWRKVLKYKIVKPVIRGNETYFCFNPIYFNSTTYINIDLYLDFQAEMKEHLPGWVIKKYAEWENGLPSTDVNNSEQGVI